MNKNSHTYYQGLALSEYVVLFTFFLTQTPEGKKVCQQLEANWAQTCETLQNEGQLKGEMMTCCQWLAQVRKKLLTPKTEKARVTKKPVHRRQKGQKNQYFRGV